MELDDRLIFAAVVLLSIGSYAVRWLWRRARTSNRLEIAHGRPDETWNGHSVWIHVTYRDHTPVQASAEIGVASPARLLIRRRFALRLRGRSLRRIDVPGVETALEVRGDDDAFAHRLFNDPVVAKTLPLALQGAELEISKDSVRVSRSPTDGVANDAAAAARALAMLVVSSLRLPPP